MTNWGGLPPIDDEAYNAWQRDLLTAETDARIRDLSRLQPQPLPTPVLGGLGDFGSWATGRIQDLGNLIGGTARQAGTFAQDVGQGLQEGFQVATQAEPATVTPSPQAAPPPTTTLDQYGFPLGVAETTAQLQGQPLPPAEAMSAPLASTVPTGPMLPTPQVYPESVWSPTEQRSGPLEMAGAAVAPLGQAVGEANTAAQRFYAGDFSAIGDVAGALVSPLAPVAETLREAQTATEATNRAQLEQLQQVTQTGHTPEEMEQFYQAGMSFAGTGPGFTDDLVGVLAKARQAAQGPRLLGPTGEAISEAAPRVEEAVSGLLGPRGEPLITRLRDLPQKIAAPAMKAVREATKDAPETATLADKITAVTMGNMFTPSTVVLNAAGNTINTFARPLRELLEGRPIASVKDVLAMVQQFPMSARRGARVFLQGRGAYPEEELAQDVMQTIGRPEAFPGRLGTVVTPIPRVNQALDEFYRSLNAAGAGAAVRHNGWGADKAAKYVADATAASVFYGAPSRLTKAVTSLGQASESNPLLNAAWRASVAAFFPFVRTTEQIGKQALGITTAPVTQIGKLLNAAFRRDPDAAREAFARWTMGMATWGVALDQYNRGNLAGLGVGTPQEEALARNARDEYGNPVRQPEAVRFGGERWVPSDFLGIYGQAASWMASAIEGYNDPGRVGQPDPMLQERLSNGFGNLGRAVSRDFYLNDFIDFASEVAKGRGPQAVARTATDLATRGVPGFVRPVVEALDPSLREPTNVAEELMARVPGLSQQVPPRIDPTTGRPVQRSVDVLSTLLRSPAPGEPNPVATEAARLERAGNPVEVRQFPREIRTPAGQAQSPAQRRAMQETYGQLTEQYTTAAMQAPGYASKSDPDKAKSLNQALSAAYQWADISLGERIARDPSSQAALDKLSFARYEGVKGTVEAMRRQNFEIREAKNKLAQYRQAYGEAGEERLFRDDRAAWRLSQRAALDPDIIRVKDRRVDQRYGMAPVVTGELGRANTTLPLLP